MWPLWSGCAKASRRWLEVPVDVVELRRGGVRLPAEVVKVVAPICGLLRMDPSRPGWYPGQRNPPLMGMLLAPGKPESLLEPLDRARVVKIDRGAMLIVGVQQHVRPIRVYEDLPQAWWVRPGQLDKQIVRRRRRRPAGAHAARARRPRRQRCGHRLQRVLVLPEEPWRLFNAAGQPGVVVSLGQDDDHALFVSLCMRWKIGCPSAFTVSMANVKISCPPGARQRR